MDSEPANIRTYQYFSFTTLTTLGYGDFTAGGSFGRAVAVLEALTGQIFLVTLVARLVSAYRGPTRPDPPPVDSADGGTVPPQLARQARSHLPRAQHTPPGALATPVRDFAPAF